VAVEGSGLESSSAEEWAQWDNHPARQQYEVLEEIGEGAFSKVVRGRHLGTHEEVALKVVHRLRPGVKPHHWEILHSEKETLQALRHPNIINLKESFEDNFQLVMVIEWLRGGELLEHLKSVKHYNEQKAAQLFRQIADAVRFMHEKGYLHRDLKPENVLFVQKPTESPNDELTVKLIDMGMATQFNPSQPVRGAMGTAGFLAPECCHRVPHSPAMDVWSLGMLLFTMLTGRMPYSHSQIERLHYPEIPITKSPGVQSQRFLNLSRDAQELLLSMLQHDPIVRITAEEVINHRWVVSEGLAKADVRIGKSAANDKASTAAAKLSDGKKHVHMSDAEPGESDDPEISYEVKASRSRKNLQAIKMQASQKSLKNLLKPKPESAGATATKSKSRFDLLSDEDTKAIKAEHGTLDNTASVRKSKSFFGDSGDEDEKKDKKSFLSGVSRKMMGKKNKVAAEPQ